MAIKQIGQNSAEEFFETILYMTAYTETQKIMQDYTKDIDNPVIREAVQSAMSVAVFGAVFYAVQKQERMIQFVFDKAEIVFMLLLGKSKKLLDKVRGFKGSKLSRLLGFITGTNQENLMTAQMVVTHQGFKSNARVQSNYATSGTSAYQMQVDTKNSLYQRENLHMQFGNSMASRYNETLLFKLLTKSFTPNDEILIKKILGRDVGAVINVDDLNQVADFMFVKDTNGKVTGLSEVFLQLVNSMGYINK